ncbi:ankyrin repeat domain-containing protein [Archangium lansingense]|uniref:Ankyrin repeat domain-containing protein n=1 Tax=Archangium lansingense TaxID=2995310 RepID=A0ABT4ANH7_9BACT|nr:ankyrin repeat domain-containing protein [Archangium lansinium]MCY1083252.1 ankyrin repeat domain-containing protein [Archangium lansinium]
MCNLWFPLEVLSRSESMLRKVLVVLGSAALVLVAVAALGLGYLFSGGRPTEGRVLAVSDAERYLLAAAREGDVEVVEGLLKAGTPVNVQNDRGFSPLILAAYHGHTEAVRVLLAAGADACSGDSRGNTALMGAAFKGHADIVELLLKQPCAVDQSNGVGQTALMFARLFGREQVAERLRQHGASEAKRDASGRTAEDWASTQSAPAPIAAPVSTADSATTAVR